MNVKEQTSAIYQIYKELLDQMYGRNFVMEMSLVMNNDIEWYSKAIENIKVISTIIETSLSSCDSKRAIRYCIMLNHSINILINRTNDDFERNIKNKLIQD